MSAHVDQNCVTREHRLSYSIESESRKVAWESARIGSSVGDNESVVIQRERILGRTGVVYVSAWRHAKRKYQKQPSQPPSLLVAASLSHKPPSLMLLVELGYCSMFKFVPRQLDGPFVNSVSSANNTFRPPQSPNRLGKCTMISLNSVTPTQ